MATFAEGDHYSAKSGADLSTNKGYVVKFNASRKVVLATAATDKIIGVLADGGRVSGDAVDIVTVNGSGSYKGIAGATIALDDFLTVDGTGRLIPTTTAGHRVIGQAAGAAVVGQQVEYFKANFKF